MDKPTTSTEDSGSDDEAAGQPEFGVIAKTVIYVVIAGSTALFAIFWTIATSLSGGPDYPIWHIAAGWFALVLWLSFLLSKYDGSSNR